MNTTRLTGLWQQVRAFLIVPAVFAGGVGAYAASRALWPFLLVWWPWLLAGIAADVALGAWWLWWRLPKRQLNHVRLTIYDPKAWADVEDNFRKTIGQLLGGAAVLIGAYLNDADLSRANLMGATVSQEQLNNACGENVKLAPPLTIKSCQK